MAPSQPPCQPYLFSHLPVRRSLSPTSPMVLHRSSTSSTLPAPAQPASTRPASPRRARRHPIRAPSPLSKHPDTSSLTDLSPSVHDDHLLTSNTPPVLQSSAVSSQVSSSSSSLTTHSIPCNPSPPGSSETPISHSSKPRHPVDSPSTSNIQQSPVHLQLQRYYDIGPKLGRGCFATVYKAIRRRDQLPVAIKVVEKNKLDKETSTLLDNELQILLAVSKHPGIVTLLDNLETESHMYFIMDYVDGGQLLDRIVSRGSFSENDARILLRTILNTLEFLSQLGCVHRDIKPENILVDNHSHKWPVKLTDFGLSAKMQPDKLLYGALGTPLFVAPEILRGTGYDCSCDMWSLGVVMYIVLCGYPPFPYNEAPANLINAIINGIYEFPAKEWHHVSDDAKDVVRRMLEIDPTKRITPTGALQHRWVLQTQSTCDLPNSQLRNFNARRKLKGGVFAVRTFGYMRNLTTDRDSSPGGVDRREKLQKDVEHCRKLITKLGMSSANGRTFIKRPGSSSNQKAPVDSGTTTRNRKSLFLPMSQLGPITPDSSLWKGSMVFGSSQATDAFTSQIMQSRAKDLLAEVDGKTELTDIKNPFIDSVPSNPTDSSADGARNNDATDGKTTPPKRAPLPKLDFNLLDM